MTRIHIAMFRQEEGTSVIGTFSSEEAAWKGIHAYMKDMLEWEDSVLADLPEPDDPREWINLMLDASDGRESAWVEESKVE